jgi:hypothetical protein
MSGGQVCSKDRAMGVILPVHAELAIIGGEGYGCLMDESLRNAKIMAQLIALQW